MEKMQLQSKSIFYKFSIEISKIIEWIKWCQLVLVYCAQHSEWFDRCFNAVDWMANRDIDCGYR